MPHLIDKETGLCTICKRLEIAAIREGKKFKRHVYDVRKLAIDNLTSKEDPNYKTIVDRHYVKYKDPFYEKNKSSSLRSILRPTFTHKIDKISLSEDFFDEDLPSPVSRNINTKSRLILPPIKNDYREILRKVNIAQVSRVNNVSRNMIGSRAYLNTSRNLDSRDNDSRSSVTNNNYESPSNNEELKRYTSIPKYAYEEVKFYPEVKPKKKGKIIYIEAPETYEDFVYEDEIVEYDSPRSVVYEILPPIYKS